MPKLKEVCRHVRSKNAGPFWITVDLFFKDAAAYAAHAGDPVLSKDDLARALNAPSDGLRVIKVPALNVLKVSYPRQHPQGWSGERDMHAGQQYVSLLEIELAAPAA